ncbi:tyrosine-protein phosphatase [Fretibacter rubidus]|uniref:tyrosine-protein phosphatase n=1 Tax=Fretibacter rubidus TaxID=570162 RepID=UPI00352B9F7F
MTRILSFDNILNFRDFGDYPTTDGRHVKAGRLFRSAHLASASETDLEKIAALNIGLVSDLRHKPERTRQPNRWPDGRAAKVVEFPDPPNASETMAPHEAFTKYDLQHANDARNYMRGSYLARPNDPAFQSSFVQTLRFMADTGEPILIHCAAGKDRTGTLAALILGVLGVPQEVIMEDYMLTMTAVDIEAYLTPASKMMSQKYERELHPDMLRPLFHVEPDYLAQSLDAIGDLDNYLHKTLGLTEAERLKMSDHYLTP